MPLVSVIIGEGGSGGAVAFATANRIAMLEHSIYSVISPEGCASILWKDAERMRDAAEALRLTAQDLKKLGVIDRRRPQDRGRGNRRDAGRTGRQEARRPDPGPASEIPGHGVQKPGRLSAVRQHRPDGRTPPRPSGGRNGSRPRLPGGGRSLRREPRGGRPAGIPPPRGRGGCPIPCAARTGRY